MLPTTVKGYERLKKALVISKLKQWAIDIYLSIWIVTLIIAVAISIYADIILSNI